MLFSTLVFFRREQAQILRCRRRLTSERERRLADYTFAKLKHLPPWARQTMAGCSIKGRPLPRGAERSARSSRDFSQARFWCWSADKLIADARSRESENKNTPTPNTRMLYTHKYERSGVGLTINSALLRELSSHRRSQKQMVIHSLEAGPREIPAGALRIHSKLYWLAVGSLKSCNTFTYTTQMILVALDLHNAITAAVTNRG